MTAPRPYNLIAELTYRCPLRCPYCSNPVDYTSVRDGVDLAGWQRILAEAADLGVVHVGLTGGEPTLRADLPEIVRTASDVGLYTMLITAGTHLDGAGYQGLADAGLRAVQIAIQDIGSERSDRIAGAESYERKLESAAAVRALDLPLTINVVLHRANIARVREFIALARALGAHRIELANTQYDGWAALNRAALMPTVEQLRESAAIASEEKQKGGIEILFVLPDFFADRPKPCMGGWAQRSLVVAPDGLVLPCQSARELTGAAGAGLEFWSAATRPLAACWRDAPGMNRFRGEAWMQEPCRSCERRSVDHGGCRCQAFRLAGDASATDPACSLSPAHEQVVEARRAQPEPWQYRGPKVRAR